MSNPEDVHNAGPVTPPATSHPQELYTLNEPSVRASKPKSASWMSVLVIGASIAGIAALIYVVIIMAAPKEGANSAIKRDNDGSQMGIVSSTISGLQLGYNGYWDKK